jgi:hypothetical protein
MIAEPSARAARKRPVQVLVASASIAGIVARVAIYAVGDGKSHDEMQVEGDTTMLSLITRESDPVTPLNLAAFKGARCIPTNGLWTALSQAVACGERTTSELPRHSGACPASCVQSAR